MRARSPRTPTALLTLLLCGAVVHGAAAAQSIELSVAVSQSGAKIDRHIFGQFAEHLGTGIYEGVWVGRDSPIPNTRGIRNDVVAALKALKVPNVRWPGGCFADDYHWRKGIGAAAQRAVTLNPSWGGVVEPNTFGTHEFMDFIAQIGSEAYLSINVGSGTPQEAAEWLEYLTTSQPTTLAQERAANGHPEPYRIPILGIGNESWDCGGNMSPSAYLTQLKIYSRFVRNFHPDTAARMLKIAVGPGGGSEARWTEWTDTIMRAWRDRQWSWDMDGLSLHNYTVIAWPPAYKSVDFGEAEYAQILNKTLEMDAIIRTHSAIMDRYDPQKRIILAVDEWGGWYAPLPGSNPAFLVQQNSLRDAVLAALNLNIFARHADRVRIANIAQMVNVLQAMIITDAEKMVLTPTYHVFRMYLPFQDATFVPVTYDAGSYTAGGVTLPRVDAIAARDTGGRLWLAVTNVDPNRAAEVVVSMPGMTARTVAGETLTAPRVDSVNTFDAPTTVQPKPFTARVQGGRVTLRLDPKSVTVVSIQP